MRARTGRWTSGSANFSETFSALRDQQNSRKRGKKSKRRKRRSKTQGTSHAFRTQRTARPYPLADVPKRGPCGSPYPSTHQKACRPPPSEAIRRPYEGHTKGIGSPREGHMKGGDVTCFFWLVLPVLGGHLAIYGSSAALLRIGSSVGSRDCGWLPPIFFCPLGRRNCSPIFFLGP